MRISAAFILPATYLLSSINIYAQDPCAARTLNSRPGEKPLTSAEIVRRGMLATPPEERHKLILNDVEFFLSCGTKQDAVELFGALRNQSVRITDATVVEADEYFIRISRDDDEFEPAFGAFKFNFNRPLNPIPQPGEKVVVTGTYSSYGREPFEINMANSPFVFLYLKQ